jgi:ribonuclease D
MQFKVHKPRPGDEYPACLMKNWPFKPATYVQTSAALALLVNVLLADDLKAQPLLAVDTESNSMHAYYERVCLVQLSTRKADYIIDPLTIDDMAPLGVLLADPGIEKVFHAAEYDLMCLKRDYDFNVVNLFDTMLAARICGYKAFGLNNLLAMHLNVEADKSHQRDNWGDRPLTPDSLLYAQMDTHYLPRLRDILHAELVAGGHWPEAEETFAEVCAATPAHDGRSFDPDGFWKLGLPQQLNDRAMSILRELYLLREEFAQERDLPPFKILGNNVLVDLARAVPASNNDLRAVRGMTPAQIRRYGAAILAAVERGRDQALPPAPAYRPPPQEISDRYTALHTWRKQRAAERGVESDVIISKAALWTLAQHPPTTLDEIGALPGVGPWRLRTYGAELLEVIAAFERQKA